MKIPFNHFLMSGTFLFDGFTKLAQNIIVKTCNEIILFSNFQTLMVQTQMLPSARANTKIIWFC